MVVRNIKHKVENGQFFPMQKQISNSSFFFFLAKVQTYKLLKK